MVEPVTMLVIGVIAAGALAVWPWLCSFLQESLLPFVREKLGEKVADCMAELVVFLDKGAVALRTAARHGWKAFQRHVLGIQTVYRRTGRDTATARTESYTRSEDDRVFRVVEEEVVAWEDMPDWVRSQMIKENATTASMDQRKAIETLAIRKAKKQGVELELDLAS